jgi:hypothetical protein
MKNKIFFTITIGFITLVSVPAFAQNTTANTNQQNNKYIQPKLEGKQESADTIAKPTIAQPVINNKYIQPTNEGVKEMPVNTKVRTTALPSADIPANQQKHKYIQPGKDAESAKLPATKPQQ